VPAAPPQNVTVEYHWLDGKYDHLPSLIAGLVGRRVAVMAIPASNPAGLAAKAAAGSVQTLSHIWFGLSGARQWLTQ
jgi:hypothetical protein